MMRRPQKQTVAVRPTKKKPAPITRSARRRDEPAEETANSAMREHILVSAQACFGRFSIPKTTVDDIVEEAKISRTTYYKHFRNKSQVILELSIRETRKINALTKAFHSQFDDIEESMVESVLFAINEGLKNPVIKHFLGPASDDMVSEILDRSNEIWELQTEEWMHLFQLARVSGRVRSEVGPAAFARWITTVQYIMLTRPLLLGDNLEEQRRMLRNFLVPSLLSDKIKRERS